MNETASEQYMNINSYNTENGSEYRYNFDLRKKSSWFNFISEQITTGIVCVDLKHCILNYNRAFLSISLLEGYIDTPADSVLDRDFYEFFKYPDIIGPDFCPFATVKKIRRTVETTIKLKTETYNIKVSPLFEKDGTQLVAYLVEMIDSTQYIMLEEKLDHLQKVGYELSDLSREEIQLMSKNERVELLKSRIQTYFKEIFNYTIFEFRLLNKETNKLEPFLSEGLSPEARDREIYAEGTGNGTTGHAAHFNHVYICDDPMVDALFMPSSSRILSAISIPLTYQGEVLGTCNVESHEPYAFTERDGYLLQLFANDVAIALHTFELLTHEGQKASFESILKVQKTISFPIDEIVRASSFLLDETSKQRNILSVILKTIAANSDANGKEADPKEILRVVNENLRPFQKYFEESEKQVRTVLSTSRDIKDRISMERVRLTRLQDLHNGESFDYPLLKNRRVLVLDKDLQVLKNAHEIFEKYGCIVETATDALTALQMVRGTSYDLILTERKPLGGMNGEQFMIRLFDLFPGQKKIPLLMTIEQGVYDPDHILPKAMERGLLGYLSRSPIYPKQLIPLFEKVLNACGAKDSAGNLLLADGSQEEINEELSSDTTADDGTSLSGSTSRIHGFMFQKGAKRFDEWASQFCKNSPNLEENDQTEKKVNTQENQNSPYDAT